MKEVKKALGYVFSILGLVGLAASISDKVRENLFGFIPDNIRGFFNSSLLIISLVVLGVGVFLLIISAPEKGQSDEEVPIFKGKEIVGYRRKH